MLPPLSITVGGAAVKRSSSPQYTQAVNLGDESLTFSIPVSDFRNNLSVYQYGARVVLTDATGYKPWSGYLEKAPGGNENVQMVCHGYGYLLDYAQPTGLTTNAILLQSMDLSIIRDAGPDPYKANTNEHVTANVTEDGFVRWVNQGPAATGVAGVVAVIPNVPIKRFAFFNAQPGPTPTTNNYYQIWQVCSLAPNQNYWYRQTSPVNYAQEIRPAALAQYSQTYASLTVTSAHPAWNYQDKAGAYPARNKPYDAIGILLGGPTSDYPGGIANMTQIRFNGSITTADTYGASALLVYLGTTMGWDTSGVRSSGINVLPYFLEDGGLWSATAGYAASIQGGTWGVSGLVGTKPAMYAGPYPRTKTDPRVWTVSRSDPGCIVDVKGSSDYNNIMKLRYQDWSGAQQLVIKQVLAGSTAAADFARLGYNRVKDATLSGTYPPPNFILPDGTKPAATQTPQTVAQALLDSYSRPDSSGTITMLSARSGGVLTPANRVRPGDGIYVTDEDAIYLVTSITGSESEIEAGVGSVRPFVDQVLVQAERDAIRAQDRFPS